MKHFFLHPSSFLLSAKEFALCLLILVAGAIGAVIFFSWLLVDAALDRAERLAHPHFDV